MLINYNVIIITVTLVTIYYFCIILHIVKCNIISELHSIYVFVEVTFSETDLITRYISSSIILHILCNSIIE